MSRRTTLLIGVLISGGLAACAAAPRGETLLESVTVYNDGVRWQRLPIAASRVPPAERDEAIDAWDRLADQLVITDWEVRRVEAGGPRRAVVHVKYTWYRPDEGTVRETHAAQHWEQRGKAWLIVEERRTRGEEMPGLAEPDPNRSEAARTAAADGAEPGEVR
jgi:hypothetical protein